MEEDFHMIIRRMREELLLFYYTMVFSLSLPFLLSETASLPHNCKGEVCIRPTLLRPHLWGYTGYVVVVTCR
uniref:Putative ovule protein n=1 Tax=Solanum chacoense TaxID=4108 RepID=A0A0V0I802_SOLCH